MPEPSAVRVVVLVSGRGRNLQALIQARDAGTLGAELVAVISQRDDAPALDRARAAGIPVQVVQASAYAERTAFDAALLAATQAFEPDWVVLAGYMRILAPDFVRAFHGRMINIHPSLLPRHPGLHTHRRALEAGDAEHGATVHMVSEELDGGPAIIQGRISVRAEDTPDTLASRVMEDVEVRILPFAVRALARGELRWRDEGVEYRGRRLRTPLQLDELEEAP